MPFDIFEIQDHDEDGQFTSQFLDFIQTAQSQKDFESFEKKLERKSKKKDNMSLDDFMGEEDGTGDHNG